MVPITRIGVFFNVYVAAPSSEKLPYRAAGLEFRFKFNIFSSLACRIPVLHEGLDRGLNMEEPNLPSFMSGLV